jgi:ABC-type branched-subunit amino acid transport system ATPase component
VLGVDERTAAAMGVSTPRRKLELFVLSSMFAALGGAVYAGTQLFVPASIVDPTAELSLLMMLFVGGRRSILGAVAGALVIQYVSGASNWVSVNILIVEGVLLTVVLLVDPEGVAGIVASLANRWKRMGPTAAGPGIVPPAEAVSGPVPGEAVSGPVPAESTNGARATGARPDARTPAFGESWQARADASARPGGTKLECVAVAKEYGGLRVLDEVGLTLPARGVFGLCGPNGAGKSTLLGVIGGSVTPSSGRVLLDGADVTRLSPQQRFHRGVSRTFQAVRLIQGRTVLDNVAVACLNSHRSSIVRGIASNRLAEARGKAAEVLEYLGMGALGAREVSTLTLENQRMVEFARAIAAKPGLLLLDEPASGLGEPQTERLMDVLRSAGDMTCVLLVEHDLDLVAKITEKIFVLASGRLVFEGDPQDFRNSALVNSLLIGL